MKFVKYLAVVPFVFVLGFTTFGQETETKVVDEVVAQVNDDVITLSNVKREMKGAVDSKVQAGAKREDAEKAVDEKQGELIANLINETLLMQKGKDLGLDTDVEGDLNGRFVQIMKQNNLKTLDQLYEMMQQQGVDPQEIRELWRKQAMRDMVLQKEVSNKLYWGFTGKELKDYYDNNKGKFTKPATISISQLFLKFDGKSEPSVRAKAQDLANQLRAGADFVKLALDNSDEPDVQKTKGKIDPMTITELKSVDEKFATALKDVKVGGVSDPVETETGIYIMHVDDRSEASSESKFDESAVRMALLQERLPSAQKAYFTQLHEDAYIKINDAYRPMVSPILFADERKEKVATN